MTITQLQETVRGDNERIGWTDRTVHTRFNYLSQEVGEVAEELLKLSYAEDEAKKEEIRRNLGEEIYDVVWNLCDLANLTGIDLEEAFRRKNEVNRHRWNKST
jgi:NTP pyrophosphatase (non-canonical NTP hydrolase)